MYKQCKKNLGAATTLITDGMKIFDSFREDWECPSMDIYNDRAITIGRYKHFKGNFYQVLGFAENTETGENMVIYKALYGEEKTYTRTLTMFSSEVDNIRYPEVTQKYRFEKANKLIILQGKIGAGKDYLAKKLEKYGFEKIVGYTTRAMRQGEMQGKEYHFITNEEFDSLENERPFLATRVFQEQEKTIKYGLHSSSIDKEKKQVVILDNLGTKQVLDFLGAENCEVIRLNCKKKVILKRAISRLMENGKRLLEKKELDKINNRLKEDKKHFEQNYDYEYSSFDTSKGAKKYVKKIMKMI